MKYMVIHTYNGVYTIKVDGYSEMRYFFYTKREAIKSYRRQNKLERKHFIKIEC